MNVSSAIYGDNLKSVENIQSNPVKSSNESHQTTAFQKTAVDISEMTDEHGQPTEQAYQVAINKLNEFMDYNQRNSKFVFHKDLKRYYVEIVDSKTQDVIKEIPPKKLLDAYYEMQKLIGKMFDKQA